MRRLLSSRLLDSLDPVACSRGASWLLARALALRKLAAAGSSLGALSLENAGEYAASARFPKGSAAFIRVWQFFQNSVDSEIRTPYINPTDGVAASCGRFCVGQLERSNLPPAERRGGIMVVF
jgi:hypothetical protein